MEPSRQILWNISNHTFLYVSAVAAVVCALCGLTLRVMTWRKGKSGVSPGSRPRRLRAVLRAVFIQDMLRGAVYPRMHRCLFYGMLLFFGGSVLIALHMHFGLDFPKGPSYLAFSLILDLAGLAVLTGVGLAAYKRYIVRPERLESGPGDAFVLLMLAAAVLSGFLVKGLRLFAVADPWSHWSPVGNGFAAVLARLITAENATHLHRIAWYSHAALAFTLIAVAPWTRLLHMLAVPLNYWLSRSWPERASLDAPLSGLPPAAGTVADCTRKQFIEADACIECGRCKKRCSITQGGMDASPMGMMKNLKRLTHAHRLREAVVGSVIDGPSLWACSMCRACEDRCPMNGAHATIIIDIRRRSIELGQVPEGVAERFAEHEAALAVPMKPRTIPAPEACDVYLWPGCHGQNETEAGTFRTLERLLKNAGLNPAVLDPPACCGGPVRRLGNERLFLTQALANIEYLRGVGGKPIVTHCPHCFNTLRNEYPRLGGDYTVLHHSQFLAGILVAGGLAVTAVLPPKVAFHDPCFLGRYNDEFALPRRLINAVKETELVEMKHTRRKGFCCGSGGGTVDRAVAIENSRRRLRQAAKAGAQAVITCCPYCEESLRAAALEERPDAPWQVMDVTRIFEPLSKAREMEASAAPLTHGRTAAQAQETPDTLRASEEGRSYRQHQKD